MSRGNEAIKAVFGSIIKNLAGEDYEVIVSKLEGAAAESALSPSFKINLIKKGQTNGSEQKHWRLRAVDGKVFAVNEAYVSCPAGIEKKVLQAINENGEYVVEEIDPKGET